MKSHFTKIKRLMIYRSILCPMLSLSAYFVYLYSFEWLAILLLALTFFIHSAFPNKHEEDPEYFKDIRILFTLKSLKATLLFLPYMFFYFWLLDSIEYTALIDQLLTREALGDWRMIIAVIGWSILWAHSNYNNVTKLEDADIIDIYDSYKDKHDAPIKMANKIE